MIIMFYNHVSFSVNYRNVKTFNEGRQQGAKNTYMIILVINFDKNFSQNQSVSYYY